MSNRLKKDIPMIETSQIRSFFSKEIELNDYEINKLFDSISSSKDEFILINFLNEILNKIELLKDDLNYNNDNSTKIVKYYNLLEEFIINNYKFNNIINKSDFKVMPNQFFVTREMSLLSVIYYFNSKFEPILKSLESRYNITIYDKNGLIDKDEFDKNHDNIMKCIIQLGKDLGFCENSPYLILKRIFHEGLIYNNKDIFN